MADATTQALATTAPPLPSSLNLSDPPPPAPQDPVLQHYTRLFEALLRRLAASKDSLSPGDLVASNDSASNEKDWRSLREELREEHVSPVAWARRTVKVDELMEQAGAVAERFAKLGAEKLAEGCLAVEREEGEEADWGGAVEALSWLSAVKSVLEEQVGEPPVEQPPLSLSNGAYPAPHTTSDHSPMLAAAPPPADLSFSFSSSAHPPSASTALEPAAMFISPSDLSAPPLSLAQTSPAPSELLARASAGLAPPSSTGTMPLQQNKPNLPASTSSPLDPPPSNGSNGSSTSSGKAAAFAARMSGLSTATAPAYENITYTSTANGASSTSSSASFAPPPAAGQVPKPKKPRSSTGGARRTSTGVVKGKGLSEVYHPPQPKDGESSRPQRKRKLPKNLTFEVSSDLDEEAEKPAAKRTKGKGKARASAASALPAAGEDEEIDELASDYEEQVAARNARSVSASVKGEEEVQQEEEDASRFPVGSAVLAKFPNYNFFPSAVLDPRTAPPTTQAKRVKGAYLVKSIPSGADHRWVPPEETHIRPITPHELAQIDANKYDVPPPSSWVKWRPELVEAARLARDPEGLADWLSRPTDLEFALAAEAERKKAAKATAGW